MFQEVTWTANELVTSAKLNLMAANDTWLRDNLVETYIEGESGTQDGQLYIESRIIDIFTFPVTYAALRVNAIIQVPFVATFLKPPIVITQYASPDANYRQVTCTLSGYNGEKNPSIDGFTAAVAHNKGSAAWPDPEVTGQYFIHYMAFGIKA